MTRKLPDEIICHLPLELDALDDDENTLRNSSRRTADLPTPNPSKSFWTDSSPGCNPLAREGSEGALTSEADVCIIGSGITGISCAYHLSRMSPSDKPLKIAVLDARDFCKCLKPRSYVRAMLIAYNHRLGRYRSALRTHAGAYCGRLT